MTDRAQRVGVWMILGVGLILRLWTLDQKSPWLDEASSWQFATSPLKDLMSATSTDVHPPLYFLLLKAWIVMWGDSLIAMRALSVLGGMAVLFFTYRLATHFVSRGVALAVLAWCAVSPLMVNYSQEARMYGLAMACALGACYGYVRWVDSDYRNRWALAGYATAAVLAMYTHYFTALLLAAIGLHAVMLRIRRRRRVPWRDWLWAHAAMAVVYLPWIGTAAFQIERGQGWWRRPINPLEDIPSYALTLIRDLSFSKLGVQVDGTFTGPLVVLLLTVGLAGLARAAIKHSRDRLLATITLVPPALGLALLLTGGHMELSRYLSYTAPLMIIGVARGLAALEVRPTGVAALLLVGATAVLPSLGGYYAAHAKDSDVRPIVAYLNDHRDMAQAAGSVLVMPGYVDSLARYVSQGGLPTRPINSDADFLGAITRTGRSWPPIWLIVDYRWPGFAALARDHRFREEAIPATTPDRIKLYRLN